MDEEGSKSKEGKIVSLNPQNGLTEKQELFCQHMSVTFWTLYTASQKKKC